jgi:hypothetical protein
VLTLLERLAAALAASSLLGVTALVSDHAQRSVTVGGSTTQGCMRSS